MLRKLIFIFLFLIFSYAFGCELEGHFEFSVSYNEELLYSGCYDAINCGPHIITYVLTKERLEAPSARRPSAPFTQDRDGGVLKKLLEENGYKLPHHNDLTRSGYDRGHMAPNADFNDTTENALMTFFIANIWPQTPEVNRVTWLRTENRTRQLATEHQAVLVIIIVEDFSEKKVGPITVPSVFKRRVYTMDDELIYEIDVEQ